MKNFIKKIWVYIFILFFLFASTFLINYKNNLTVKSLTQEFENFKKDAISLQEDVKKLKTLIEIEIAKNQEEHDEIMEHEHPEH